MKINCHYLIKCRCYKSRHYKIQTTFIVSYDIIKFRNYNLRVMVSILKKKPTSDKEGGGSMEILKLLLINSDTVIFSIIGCFIYDKLKSHSNGDKSDFKR
jgi:hypothetical protein